MWAARVFRKLQGNCGTHEGAACIKCQLYSRLFLAPVLVLLMREVGWDWC